MDTQSDVMYVTDLLKECQSKDEQQLSTQQREVLIALRDAKKFVEKWHRGVCKIVRDGDEHKRGSGFHWGNGWVLTNAHVFTGYGEDNANADSTGLRFEFYDDGENGVPTVFRPQTRLAVVADVKTDAKTSNNDLMINSNDLAMIKLGHQFEYQRAEVTDWEKDEQERLANIPAFVDLRLKSSDETTGEKEDVWEKASEIQAFPIHFGSEFSEMQVSRPREASKYDERLISFSSYVSEGSSGSPLFGIVGDQFKLIGVVEGKAESIDQGNCAIAIDSPLMNWMTKLHQHAQRFNASRETRAWSEYLDRSDAGEDIKDKLIKIEQANNLVLIWPCNLRGVAAAELGDSERESRETFAQE